MLLLSESPPQTASLPYHRRKIIQRGGVSAIDKSKMAETLIAEESETVVWLFLRKKGKFWHWVFKFLVTGCYWGVKIMYIL